MIRCRSPSQIFRFVAGAEQSPSSETRPKSAARPPLSRSVPVAASLRGLSMIRRASRQSSRPRGDGSHARHRSSRQLPVVRHQMFAVTPLGNRHARAPTESPRVGEISPRESFASAHPQSERSLTRRRVRLRSESGTTAGPAAHGVQAIQSSTSKVKKADTAPELTKLPNTIQCDTGYW